MITKERLEELIEQGADIWVLYENKIYPHKAKDVAINGFNCVSIGFDFNHLFETKEDAEEYAEFGNITRTERLELPSWEDILEDSDRGIWFNSKSDSLCRFHISFNDILIIKDVRIIFEKPLTRENYNEARRLCVKLFKGESV